MRSLNTIAQYEEAIAESRILQGEYYCAERLIRGQWHLVMVAMPLGCEEPREMLRLADFGWKRSSPGIWFRLIGPPMKTMNPHTGKLIHP